jgi:hydrogenase maturation protein HypF
VTAVGRRIAVRGIVQGVGFRPWVYRLAHEEGLTGRVGNDDAGVIIDAFGDEEAVDQFADRVIHEPPPAAEILDVTSRPIAAEQLDTFVIVPSTGNQDLRVSIPPDLATCPQCLREIFDPGNRRYRYAFTNCTHCGPRFTIARDVPYDRAATTMAGFMMCEACRLEYDDPGDRRFHAQPNACPTCGPRLELIGNDGRDLAAADPIASAAAAV